MPAQPHHCYPVLWRVWGLCLVVWLAVPGWAQDASPGTTRASLLERLQARRNARVQPEAQALAAPGDYVFSLVHQGHARSYRVHVPASYSPQVPAALVVALHGGGGNMDYQANDAFYGQISLSERLGAVLVFPNGFSRVPGGKLATWNAGHCCGAARDAAVDDVGFIRAMVARLRSQLAIDPQRIFANGMSNGGMMAYRLACEAPDLFRAIASVAGTDNTVTCNPAQPISVLHIHARDDDRVLFQGGAGQARAAVSDFVSVPATVARWVGLNGCPAAPQRVLQVPGATCERYAPCRDGVQVQLCVTDTGGHAWPGGTKVRAGTAGSSAISATDVLADFYSRQ